jgi:hypothetical protein
MLLLCKGLLIHSGFLLRLHRPSGWQSPSIGLSAWGCGPAATSVPSVLPHIPTDIRPLTSFINHADTNALSRFGHEWLIPSWELWREARVKRTSSRPAVSGAKLNGCARRMLIHPGRFTVPPVLVYFLCRSASRVEAIIYETTPSGLSLITPRLDDCVLPLVGRSPDPSFLSISCPHRN